MVEENISQEFSLKNTDQRNYFTEGINQNELMTNKHKKVFSTLNYIEHLLILISAVMGFFSISAFAFLVSVHIGIGNSAVGLKICAITSGMKKYKSIIKKRKEIW